jgi:hypothetical protein
MAQLIADLLWGLIEYFCWRERDADTGSRGRRDPDRNQG